MKEPIEKSALLLVDIQESFKAGGRWEKRSNHAFEANVAKLVATWRDASLPVFFILHTDGDPGFDRNDPEFRVMDFLNRRDDEPLLVKNTRNSFTSTDLQERLDARGIRRVVVCGATTEQCCETTTRVAADLGYDVDYVTEATVTFPIESPEGSLSTDQIIQRTELVLRGRFARIVTVAELAKEVEGALAPSNS